MAESKDIIGVYVNRNPDEKVIVISILKPDGTCGMFLVPTPQVFLWLGFTTYQSSGNLIKFTVQGIPAPDGKSTREPGPNDEKYVEAKLDPGKGYVQQEGRFDFLSNNLKYWLAPGHDWKDIGEARQLEGPKDFDTTHEIRKIILATVQKFGNDFGW